MCKTGSAVLSFATLVLSLSPLGVTRLASGAAAAPSSEARASTPDPNRGPAAQEAPAVVARIGDDTILRPELEERLLRAIRPREEEYPHGLQPVTADAVLREMLGDKAMSLEGRKLGYLKDETIHARIEEVEQGRLAGMVQASCFSQPPAVDAKVVDAILKQRPQLNREQATQLAQRSAALQILERFYRTLIEKYHLKKVDGNFAKAAQIHQRLLQRPAKPRGPSEYWILTRQVREELSDEEKNLMLATYDGGQFTLQDWFRVVCNIAPPRRPDDLGTAAGVEKLLERALRLPLFVAEAKARGYDKDPKLRAEIRQYEDQMLLGQVQQEKTKELHEPTAEEIKAYFEKNKDRFARAATMKISQVWCPSLEAAKKVKAELDGGADFETIRKANSLQKEETPHVASAVGEGLFWPELWKADPNQVVGPLRGFYGSGAKWRVVKVLEKTPAQPQPYSEQLANSVKSTLMDEQRQRLLDEYRTELLKKYPHEIFADRIKDLDPLEIATNRQDQ